MKSHSHPVPPVVGQAHPKPVQSLAEFGTIERHWGTASRRCLDGGDSGGVASVAGRRGVDKVKKDIYMQLCFDESCIQYWADRYDSEQSSNQSEREGNLIAIKPQVQQDGYLTMETLKEIVVWLRATWNLSESLIGQYSDAHIRNITSQAFMEIDIDESLRVLMGLDGVGDTIGSAILHLFHKDKYPIYSRFALKSVCERKSEGVWRPYVNYCRVLRARNEISIRTLDKALRKYSETSIP